MSFPVFPTTLWTLGDRARRRSATLDRLDHDAFSEANIDNATDRLASYYHYDDDIRDIDADTPGRLNADPKRLFETSVSAR